MTEPRGRAARWQASLLLVPGAAVSFGAAVAWAAGTTPASNSSAPSTPPGQHARAATHPRAADLAYRHRLEAQLREHRRHVGQLQNRLKLLRAQTARLAQLPVAVPVGPIAAPPPVPGGPVYVPPPPPVYAPPPAPPVHTTTGASGHP
jgi:hypothetical protein